VAVTIAITENSKYTVDTASSSEIMPRLRRDSVCVECPRKFECLMGENQKEPITLLGDSECFHRMVADRIASIYDAGETIIYSLEVSFDRLLSDKRKDNGLSVCVKIVSSKDKLNLCIEAVFGYDIIIRQELMDKVIMTHNTFGYTSSEFVTKVER